MVSDAFLFTDQFPSDPNKWYFTNLCSMLGVVCILEKPNFIFLFPSIPS